MLPDLNRLQVFYHVYHLNSINAAARALHLTQPAISQQIKKLELELQTPLFTRMHKKIIPTSAAERLFSIIRPFMQDIADNIKYIAKPLNKPFGPLSIGAPIEFGKQVLPKICQGFRQKYRDVTLRFRLDEPDVILGLVRDGTLDFALVDYFSDKDQFLGRPDLYRIEPVAKEIWVLACSVYYHDTFIRGDYAFENLERQTLLTDEYEPVILRHWFWHHFKKVPPELNIVMAIDSHQALLSCIRLGMGLAVTARHIIEPEIESGAMKVISTTEKNIVSKISLVQLAQKKNTLTEQVFQDYLKAKIMDTQR